MRYTVDSFICSMHYTKTNMSYGCVVPCIMRYTVDPCVWPNQKINQKSNQLVSVLVLVNLWVNYCLVENIV